MNDHEITPQEAQQRLDERRRELKVVLPPKTLSMEERMERLCNPTEDERKRRDEKARLSEERQKRWEEEERVYKISRLTSDAHLPLRHSKTEIDHAKPKNQEWQKAYDKMFSSRFTGFLMGLAGTRGNGKTQLAVELCKSYCREVKAALFITAMEFFIDIKSTFRKDEERTEKEALDEYQRYALLVIDEIGIRAETDWENQLLFELINRRYNSKLDTLLISNHSRNDFIKSIGCGLASRMNETGGIIECNWESFRK